MFNKYNFFLIALIISVFCSFSGFCVDDGSDLGSPESDFQSDDSENDWINRVARYRSNSEPDGQICSGEVIDGMTLSERISAEMQLRKDGRKLASNPECRPLEASTGLGIAATLILSTFAPFLVPVSIAQIVHLAGCSHAFVRDPVERFMYDTIDDQGNEVSAGSYKVCTNKDSQGNCVENTGFNLREDNGDINYSRASNKKSSDFIEVCHRMVMGGAGTATLDPREDDFDDYGNTDGSLCRVKRDIGGALDCIVLREGEKKRLHDYVYQAKYEGDKICAYLWGLGSINDDIPFYPQAKIGCHLREPTPPTPLCEYSIPKTRDAGGVVREWDDSGCYQCNIAQSCYSMTSVYSRAPFPISSVIVQCLDETLENILVGGCIDPSTGLEQDGFIANVRKKLKRAIRAILAIAVAIFGIKLALNGIQGQQDYFVLMFKLVFVVYFAVGPGMDQYYPELRKISKGLASFVIRAGGNPTVCNYDADDYMIPVRKRGAILTDDEKNTMYQLVRSQRFREFRDGANNNVSSMSIDSGGIGDINVSSGLLSKLQFKDYSHLAVWDMLDCRLAFYLSAGVDTSGPGGAASVAGQAGFAGATAASIALNAVVFGIIACITALIMGFQLILACVVIFYVIMIVLVIGWAVHLYMIASVAFAIIVLLSPIFIPMVLFQVTKNFFDSWLKELMAYTLYPVMIFTFVALFISVFDKLYFKDLQFKENSFYIGGEGGNMKAMHMYALDTDQNDCTEKENASNLYCIMGSFGIKTQTFMGISFNTSDIGETAKEMWLSLLLLSVVAFLFYNFFGLVGTIAAELTGSFRSDISRGTMTPDQAFAKGAGMIANVAEKMSGGDGSTSQKITEDTLSRNEVGDNFKKEGPPPDSSPSGGPTPPGGGKGGPTPGGQGGASGVGVTGSAGGVPDPSAAASGGGGIPTG